MKRNNVFTRRSFQDRFQVSYQRDRLTSLKFLNFENFTRYYPNHQ